MDARQDADNLAWDQSHERWEKALKHVRASATCRKVEAFASRTFGKPSTVVTPLIIGGFNVVYPFKIQGMASQVLVRLPCPDQAIFPEEKTMVEVATAACIKQHTQVPIPKIFHHGCDEEIGPYMIIEDLDTRRGMSHALETPRDDPNDAPILNPKISETQLKDLYLKMEECVLPLSQPTFPHIGALVESSPSTYEVLGRPITLNMNNMFQLSNIPLSVFPHEGSTYSTADEWYAVLAEMQMVTLVFQHNDIISSEDDCRTKNVARKLFHRLAEQKRLTRFGFCDDDWSASSEHPSATLPSPDNSGSFRIWSDDFRPVNVLINDENNVVGAIDWEYAYVGPSQFTLDPPWWLLLEVPEMWDDGIEDWASTYEQRLETWLSAMEEAEKKASSDLPLSAHMRESWATSRFWLNYAARKSLSNHAVIDRYRLSLTAAHLLDTPLLTATGLAAFRRLGPLFSWIEREAGNAIAVFVHYLMRLDIGPCLPSVLFQRLREREELKEALSDPGAMSARAVERLIKPLTVLQ
ncbi:phosphotransferase [Fusarium agapanthi]|uniref:Phosphotransferase n=1 Tax=Fusarium agapanthi TaxID=1803897 RepID=A0A9P5AZ62_9HYPO|nr:phosphotransferase [Fusarium agapanthi]